jgi:hypothetical protein
MSIDVYLKVVQIMRAVELHLKNGGFDRKTATNIKYYVAMMYAIAVAGGKAEIAGRLGQITHLAVDDAAIGAIATHVNAEFESAGGTDQVAKGSIFVETLLADS